MNHFRQGLKNIPEICFRLGVKTVIIAPGSRNAPLIFAFTSHPEMNCLSIVDERSAAYFAVGIAAQNKQAVALVCTSGTAVLNFAPAIAEAYYQNLPLLVFTADRPAELIDQADGQTLRQSAIYANYIKASFNLPLETSSDIDLQFSDRQISQAINTALSFPQGPAHINVPLREPIYTNLPDSHSNPKIFNTISPQHSLTNESAEELQNVWLKSRKKMIVFGVFAKNQKLNELANLLAEQDDVVVIGENLSNINGPKIITQPESLFASLSSKQKEHFQPDLLVTIGHSSICKELKQFLREFRPAVQWQLESSLPYIDTYQSLTTILPGSSVDILSKMPTLGSHTGYAETFQLQKKNVAIRHEAFTQQAPFSDFTAIASVLSTLPSHTHLHLANSTAVRWAQLFETRSDINYFCNRGTSGIDGSLSTAAGYAYTAQLPTVFLCGDLSFIYDSNGLWNHYISTNLKIIVLNNNGGNIFRCIGDKKLMKSSLEFFTTPHSVKIKSLVEAYGLNYMSCDSAEHLETSIHACIESKTPTVLEIFTNADINTKNYTTYFEHLKNNN